MLCHVVKVLFSECITGSAPDKADSTMSHIKYGYHNISWIHNNLRYPKKKYGTEKVNC